MRSILLPVLGAIPLAFAQTTTSASASAASSGSPTSSQPITHTIGVAEGGFTFVPNVVLAEVGDYIEYQFYPKNHSVVRSEYGFPCIPYEDTGVDRIGFFSGFMPVDTIISNPPSYTIRVNDTEPIFYYCSAPGSCITYGMVGVINPNGTESVAVQTQLAMNSTFMLQPGEPWPSEQTNPFSTTSSATPSATPSPTSTSTYTSTVPTASATTSAAVAASSSSSGLSGGGIAGVVIGAAAVALLAAALLFMCGRHSKKHNSLPPPGPYPVTYVDPSGKHMSVMTHPYQPDQRGSFYARQSGGYASPPLPGYVPVHDPGMSPPLPPVRPASTALNQAGGSEITNPRSPSPSDGNRSTTGAPIPSYPDGEPQMVPAHGMYGVSSEGPHELHAGNSPLQGGVMGFIRRNSLRKSGGVERYG